MKKIFILIISFLTCISLCYAAESSWDCALFSTKDAVLKSLYENDDLENFAEIMPKEAMEKVFENLNKYCCEKKINTSCIATNDSGLYPESIYIFDHILDVYLRRLDAKQDNDNWKDLLYGLEPDPLWKDWREFIIERGNDVEWSLPLEIQKKYGSMWKGTQHILRFSQYTYKTINDWKANIKSAVNSYDSRTLYDKYNLACDLTKYVSENVIQSINLITTKEYDNCKDLIKNRIDNENKYMKAILMQKANTLLTSSIKAYINTYFVGNKLSELQKIINDMNSSFFEVNKSTEKLTNECS